MLLFDKLLQIILETGKQITQEMHVKEKKIQVRTKSFLTTSPNLHILSRGDHKY